MKRIRIGLVGCGTIANVMHLPGIATMREMGKADLVAVCDTIPEKAREAAEKFGAPRHFGDLDAMLREVDFDLLVNNTPIPSHFPVSMAALAAGRHVYTQKPMATTLDEATRLVDEAKRRGLSLAVAPEHPTRPMIRKIRQMIDDGAIGKVTFAKILSSHNGPETHDVPRDSTWFYKPDSGPILDMGVHGLSQITAVLGPVRRLACFSGKSQPTRVTTAGPFKGKVIPVEVDDNSLLMLDFGDSRFAYLDSTYCMPATRGPQTEIYGTAGTLSVTQSLGVSPGATLHHYSIAKKEWREVPVEAPPPVKDLGVLHMVESLRGEHDLILTGERGRHLVEIMTRAVEAARSGASVSITSTF